MKLGLYVNDGNSLSISTAEEFIKLLNEQNIKHIDVKKVDEKCDLIVVFGGDGSTVRVINYAVKPKDRTLFTVLTIFIYYSI